MKKKTLGMKGAFLATAFAAGLSLWTASCGGCGEPKPQTAPAAETEAAPSPPPEYSPADKGDTLVIGGIGDAINLMPFMSSDATSHSISSLVFNALVTYDENLDFAPELAETWEVSEDNKSFTFHLRKDVKWHDGQPFTAADVELTFQAITHKETPTAYAEDYLRVEKLEVLDPHTVRVTYPEPYSPALDSWTNLQILPAHILKDWFSPESNRIVDCPLKEKPVGTGPYVFKSWTRQQEILLEANPDYFRGPFKIKQYRFRVIADLSTMFNELRAGGLDEMPLTPQQFVKQANTEEMNRRFNKFAYLSRGYTYMGFNLKHPVFSDKKVRQAVSYGINKNEIIDGVYLGQGEESTGPYVPMTRWNNPAVKGYPYDPAKATMLLGEAGWTDSDGDGVLDKDGKPFKFTLITNAGNDVREKIATVIQSNLKVLGIQVEIQTIEWAAFLKEFIHKRNYDAFILGWSLGIEPDQYLIWHTSQMKEGSLNHVGFSNEAADHLLEEGRRVLDLDERQKIYWQFHEIVSEEAPYVFLVASKSNIVIDKRFQGVRPVPMLGINYSFMNNEWWVPQALHKYK